MNFVSYCMQHELPLNGDEYNIIADGEIFAYLYDIDESKNLAVHMGEDSYAVFRLDDNEINNQLTSKIHDIRKFYRETKGQQTKHLSQDTIRQINTIFSLNRVITDITFRNVDSILQPIGLEKRQLRNGETTCWGIYFNNIPIFHLSSEDLVDRIFRIMKSDLTAYIMQRWRRT